MIDKINTVIQGNNLEKLKLLPDNSVDCCITSPSYFGLRDYGTATWVGGDPGCDHTKASNMAKDIGGAKKGQDSGYHAKVTEKVKCGKCGAVRKDDQVGLEATPEEYVKKMVAIFEEVRRILKPTGTLWLNLGDSYAGAGGASGHTKETKNLGANTENYGAVKSGGKTYGLKPKDLIGIPWMVAFALRDAGWYLRSSIIWYKKNPMPESVRDRPTKSHENIFLLSKSRKYYYDAEAIRTEPTENTILRMSQQVENQKGSNRAVGKTNGTMKAVGPGKNVRPAGVDSRGGNQQSETGISALPANRGHVREHQGFKEAWDNMSKAEQQANGANKKDVWIGDDNTSTWQWMFDNFPADMVQPLYDQYLQDTGNKPDIWDVTTKPFKEAHFATFPEDLVVDMVKAGTSEYGCCSSCGNPWQRVTEPLFDVKHTGETDSLYPAGTSANRLAMLRQAARDQGMEYNGQQVTVGWEPTYKCETKEVTPAIVLDPFDGAGTTRLVTRRLGRNSIGIELNPEYIKIGDKRLFNAMGLFL